MLLSEKGGGLIKGTVNLTIYVMIQCIRNPEIALMLLSKKGGGLIKGTVNLTIYVMIQCIRNPEIA